MTAVGKKGYIDLCDRLALRRLLPKHGGKFVDVCCGYGRLTNEYLGRYKEVFLFDCAPNLLSQAKNAYGGLVNIVQGSVYKMPFTAGEFDALIMVRAAHHLTDLNAAVGELARILKNNGAAVIEIANKHNFFEILCWLCGRSKLKPFTVEPERKHKEAFFWFHPRYAERIFMNNGLYVKKTLAVSGLRSHAFQIFFWEALLCAVECFLQYTIGRLKWSASVFYLLQKNA